MVLKDLILNSFYLGVSIYGGINSVHPTVELTWHLKKLGVFEHMGVLGYQGGVQMHGGIQTYGGCQDAPKHMGCQLDAPKCRTYMPLKKNRGV